MSSRAFSRPRTRIYDVNYNIGENYYKGALDRLDRKYSGRPVSPAPRQSSAPKEILERHERAFADEDLSTARARASKTISEANAFDTRGSVISKALESIENEIDEETAAKLHRIRANKKVSILDDVDLESTMSNIKARRIKDRAEQMLDSVGIDTIDHTKRPVSQALTYKVRSVKMTTDSSIDNSDLTKWSKVNAEENSGAAAIRAKQSRARLNELEDEMNALAEKAQNRERRAARLRQFMAETVEDNEAVSMQSKRISSRQKREAIEM